ncbi:sorting nexin-24-like isoform X2 [Diachasma alloeum]|uniref:sorting nexin-24-like isoform X2 n=1 Tax=Diachasma alloeum TaxID=454923 RepID=UPI00073840D7|nr:sorting nexin-24-like isoform X2 [Diachasma alloeum]
MTLRVITECSTKGGEMYRVFITGYRLAEVTHGKSFYVYTIQLTDANSGIKYSIERRYSEFNSLHRMLKRDGETAAFPPKRVRSCQPKVLEHRRAALEVYIQKMLQLPSTRQQVLEFLGIEGAKRTGRILLKRLDGKSGSTSTAAHVSPVVGHHPVITFKCDPYVTAESQSGLPDIVTQGVLLGFYKSENY